MVCIVVLFCVFFMYCSSCEGVKNLPENVKFPAVFAFGDSLADTGNNNPLKTPIKSNFPPYGKDLNGGLPTGRFSNGKIIPDLIGTEGLGVKELIPAYNDPNLNSFDMKTGVSFASGGSGYDPLTPRITLAIPLSTQLELFKDYIQELKGIVGEEEAQQTLNHSIYLLISGNNDVANYFNVGVRRIQYDIFSYADLLVTRASSIINEMYRLGARKIAVFSVIPVGCLPAERTVLGGFTRKCAEKINQGVKIINAKLYSETNSLTQKLPQSRVVFIDIYKPLLDAMENPQRYGNLSYTSYIAS
ncbi:hypothetical protein ACJIZ3_002745 [Penstemon smallii]|uniref:Uncharacterized protein n=1 Tax=Penstemon smallii TaxID=265156 RepID=A0ABD3U793_9LAMI